MATVNIKNMVCDRCIASVQDLLVDMGYTIESVELGKADITEELNAKEREKIARELQERGFELIRESKDLLVEEVKAQLITYLALTEQQDDAPKLSKYLSRKLHRNYSYLSSRFSEVVGITIERYVIQLKIERVKELLSYQEYTLSEIAWKLNYSSVQYLSNQFKDVTGETVSSFRTHLDTADRRSLDDVS
ncbi:helix-turn-helix domain-containing protein [Fodinibius halophilus]|uniref:Helix-turn-helix transcriptional regulator n=1 Tax=Fodinibius halophilus TaxID=1736908 RepID=A0A6M1TLQ9_9BACT|nr:AraC family transcriptional regulator [Fodinibius halophilus]NGP89360.1 helix-turn-helix transcriptional regulator [Fodinibius halophilus]